MVPANLNAPGGYSIALATDGMYVSTDFGRSWSRADFTGVVDDIAFPALNAADIQVIAARGSVFLSRDRGSPGTNWPRFAGGPLRDHPGRWRRDRGWRGRRLRVQYPGRPGAAFGKQVSRAPTSPGSPSFITRRSIITSSPATRTKRVPSAAAERARDGWKPARLSGPGRRPWTGESAYVCRFYGDLVRGPNSHFYSASTAECRDLLGLQLSIPDTQPRWNSEGYAFKVSLPNAGGQCGNGLLPVFRAYNDGFAHGVDSNHRYVVDQALLAPLLAQGWKDEGIAFCAGDSGRLNSGLGRLEVPDLAGLPAVAIRARSALLDCELYPARPDYQRRAFHHALAVGLTVLRESDRVSAMSTMEFPSAIICSTCRSRALSREIGFSGMSDTIRSSCFVGKRVKLRKRCPECTVRMASSSSSARELFDDITPAPPACSAVGMHGVRECMTDDDLDKRIS